MPYEHTNYQTLPYMVFVAKPRFRETGIVFLYEIYR